MKIIALMMLVLMSSLAFAEGEVCVSVACENAGITPDSTLYGLDTALEKLQLAITTNKQEKAKLELEFAQERVEEVVKMINEKKEQKYIDVARNGYALAIGHAFQLAGELTPEEKKVIIDEIQAKVKEHQTEAKTVSVELPAQIPTITYGTTTIN